MTIEEASELLRRGEVVAFPTETVYGLGADAWNPEAIKKIFAIKGRPGDNPLIIHLSGKSQVHNFTPRIPEAAQKLMDACWPGPLTLVFEKKPEVFDIITGGLPTVALRVPDHPAALDLIRRTGPLAAPSANRSGRPSPTRSAHVRREFGATFPVVEGGLSDVGLESTVLDVSRPPFTVLRPGKYTFRQLESIAGVRVIAEKQTPAEESRSPGVKYTHYRPSANVTWYNPSRHPDKQQTLLISHTGRPGGFRHHIHVDGDFEQLARQLYDLFRMADLQELSDISVEPLPPEHAHPLIAALQNRIEKAIG
ncbi:MAG: L-threonylcarbamoyladenylate synthase [Balneolaceae bacterium]